MTTKKRQKTKHPTSEKKNIIEKTKTQAVQTEEERSRGYERREKNKAGRGMKKQRRKIQYSDTEVK